MTNQPDYSIASGDCSGPAGYCGAGGVFHFGYTETILFGPWQIDSVGGLIGSMFAIVVMTLMYEGLKYYRESVSKKKPECGGCPSQAAAAAAATAAAAGVRPPMWNGMHLYQTFLHAVQIIVSNLVMLIFMTYNVWLCLAVTIGGTIGFFLLGWKKSSVVDVTEQCH